jgi:hypothetical protein
MSFHEHIALDFAQVGARAMVRPLSKPTQRVRRPMSIDIATDEAGEFFDIRLTPDVYLETVDIEPHDRHLVLRASNPIGNDRFLCGHDEFHWFVAALPHLAEASSAAAAKEALKPRPVVRLEQRKELGTSNRRHDVYLRQGEWFFVPCRHASIDLERIVRGGELLRGEGSKPHQCDYLYEDGEREYECERYPQLAFFETEYRHILQTRRKASQWKWRPLPFRPKVYVKGWIRHADHSPMYLDVWHRVEKNTEPDELSMSWMVYRD